MKYRFCAGPVNSEEGGSKLARRIIGVIGGMGPDATADFFREIIRLTPARADQEHIPVLIYSNTEIPDRTNAILDGGEDPTPSLVYTAEVLERAGAGLLTVPCNAAHLYLPRVREQVSVPILDMILETCRSFKRLVRQGTAVGLLATTGTVRCGIYEHIFGQAGVRVLLPGDDDQSLVQSCVGRVKAGDTGSAPREVFESVGARLMAAGAQMVVLGCTEVPLAFREEKVGYPTLNPTRILARAAVDWALEETPPHRVAGDGGQAGRDN
jgi:aspartate racemase